MKFSISLGSKNALALLGVAQHQPRSQKAPTWSLMNRKAGAANRIGRNQQHPQHHEANGALAASSQIILSCHKQVKTYRQEINLLVDHSALTWDDILRLRTEVTLNVHSRPSGQMIALIDQYDQVMMATIAVNYFGTTASPTCQASTDVNAQYRLLRKPVFSALQKSISILSI